MKRHGLIPFIVIALIAGVVSPPARAVEDAGLASDLFVLGAGARSMAMGGAFTALADDASAPYYNPAGLAHLDSHQLSLMYAPIFMDTTYSYLASAHPLGDRLGTLAVSNTLLFSDGFETRDRFNQVTDSNASLSHNSLAASYAHLLSPRWSVGGTAKLIRQKIVNFSDTAVAADLGTLYRLHPRMTLGASFINANQPSIKLREEEDNYKPITRLGVAVWAVPQKIVITTDMIRHNSDSKFAAGGEVKLATFLAARAGFNTAKEFTTGLGIAFSSFQLDYAFSNNDVGSLNKVSLTWAWRNIYKTRVRPPYAPGKDAVVRLEGTENKIAFALNVPNFDVAHWVFHIKDKAGQVVRTMKGDLRPPEVLDWDVISDRGEPVRPGLYTYQFDLTYKNGKEWTETGDIKLILPDPTIAPAPLPFQLNGSEAPTQAIEEPVKETSIANERAEPLNNPIPEPTPQTQAEEALAQP